MENNSYYDSLLLESDKSSKFLESEDFNAIEDTSIKNAHRKYHYHIHGALLELKSILGIKDPENEIVYNEP